MTCKETETICRAVFFISQFFKMYTKTHFYKLFLCDGIIAKIWLNETLSILVLGFCLRGSFDSLTVYFKILAPKNPAGNSQTITYHMPTILMANP